MSEDVTVGLALSGGAARGFAHIGVVKALQTSGIQIDCVAGTSAGAIVGALYCGGFAWDEMLEVARSLEWAKLVSPTLSGMGLVRAEALEGYIGELLGEVDFSELTIPFRAVAVDISRSEIMVLSSGSVARAVRASSAVPGIFEPVLDGEAALVDGGVVNNLPVDCVRDMGAGSVIAVDLNAHRTAPSKPVNLLDVTYRSFAILLDATSEAGRESADILVQPDLADIGYHDLSNPDELVARGQSAAGELIEEMKRLR